MFKTALDVRSVKSGWVLESALIWDDGDIVYLVPAGFETDLASIPKGLRWLVSNDDSRVRRPAVLHDWLCSLAMDGWRTDVKGQRITFQYADRAFFKALVSEGVGYIKASLMYFAVVFYSVFLRELPL